MAESKRRHSALRSKIDYERMVFVYAYRHFVDFQEREAALRAELESRYEVLPAVRHAMRGALVNAVLDEVQVLLGQQRDYKEQLGSLSAEKLSISSNLHVSWTRLGRLLRKENTVKTVAELGGRWPDDPCDQARVILFLHKYRAGART